LKVEPEDVNPRAARRGFKWVRTTAVIRLAGDMVAKNKPLERAADLRAFTPQRQAMTLA
jgi:hypothetical protein